MPNIGGKKGDVNKMSQKNARDILKDYWDLIGGKPGLTTSSARMTAKKRRLSSKGTGDEPQKQPKHRRGRKPSSTLAAIHTGSSSQRDGGGSPLASDDIREKANADRAERASKRKKDIPAPRASRKNITRPLVAQPGERGEHSPSTPPATGSAEAGRETAMQR
ncbi:MAG: hypothetical protein LQ341_005994 [Variospora aurantia]|nr:MAG: hypothetical protein LQ341_005994 [Variospora aurantia]